MFLYKELPLLSQDHKVTETIMNPTATQAQILEKLQLRLYKELEKEVLDPIQILWLEARITAASEAYKNLKL